MPKDNNITCPLCQGEEPMEYKTLNGSHAWICTNSCPAILFEYWTDKNTKDITTLLTQKR